VSVYKIIRRDEIMKSQLKLILLLLASSTLLFSGNTPEECYIQIDIKDVLELHQLTKVVSIDRVRGEHVFAYTMTNRLEEITKLGYTYQRLPHPGKNPGARMGMVRESGTKAWDAYPTYSEYTQMMQDYATNYPDICRLVSIGSSTNTAQPHELWALKITDNPDVIEEEPEVFYTSTMHGDETVGFVLMLHLIDEILTHYDPSSADPYTVELTNMVQNMEIWINPLSNPDGTYHGGDNSVSGAIRYLSTTAGANAGVDPNRNFPDPEDGPHPDGNVYWGETQLMMNFADQHHFVLSSNFHGGAELVNYPWDTWARLHADDSWFINLSRDYADQAQADSPAGYLTDQDNGITNGYAWYEANGGRQDYMNYYKGCKEVTIELSSTKNPAASSLPTLWDSNKLALIRYLQKAMTGIHGLVKNASGTPLQATIDIVGYDLAIDQSYVYTDPSKGDYYRMLLPGTYTIRASSYGYIDQEISNVTVPATGRIRQDFTLQAAQTVNITGTVLALPTHSPIENATVQVLNTPLPPVQTNAQGQYTIPNVLEGTYTFKVTAVDHETVEEERQVSTSNTTQNFSLPRITVFSTEDFENDNGGGTSVGTWEWGEPTTGLSAHSGSKVWGTNLDGNYGNSEHSYLTISGILVPDQRGKVSFWHWYEFEGSGTLYDGGRLELSTDGTNFTPITPIGGYTGPITGLSGDAGYGGTSTNWVQATFDISAYAGDTVTLRWHFASDGSSTQLGWYIDDLQILGMDTAVDPIFKDDFESGDSSRWSTTASK
jgi:hypothetical protein